ncbi:MAG: hypothetical protein ACLR8M_00725 [Oscillospiraceae bacterium]
MTPSPRRSWALATTTRWPPSSPGRSGQTSSFCFSDIDGLFTADPHSDPAAKLIPVVERLTPEIERLACGAGSKFGTGGMQTKLHAAHIATEAGVPMVIANGAQPAALYDLMDGKPVGTKFLAREEKA